MSYAGGVSFFPVGLDQIAYIVTVDEEMGLICVSPDCRRIVGVEHAVMCIDTGVSYFGGFLVYQYLSVLTV